MIVTSLGSCEVTYPTTNASGSTVVPYDFPLLVGGVLCNNIFEVNFAYPNAIWTWDADLHQLRAVTCSGTIEDLIVTSPSAPAFSGWLVEDGNLLYATEDGYIWELN
jgi:hypothetical protein